MSILIGLAKTLAASLLAESKLATELPTLMPNLSVVVNGVTMNCTQVADQAKEHISLEEQLASLKAQTKEAQTNIKGVRIRMKATLQQVKAAATGAFGSGSTQFVTLGFTPPKTRKTTTAAEKALGAAKNLATRVLRGTRGSRQKEALHGTVPATAPAAAPAQAPVTPAVVK